MDALWDEAKRRRGARALIALRWPPRSGGSGASGDARRLLGRDRATAHQRHGRRPSSVAPVEHFGLLVEPVQPRPRRRGSTVTSNDRAAQREAALDRAQPRPMPSPVSAETSTAGPRPAALARRREPAPLASGSSAGRPCSRPRSSRCGRPDRRRARAGSRHVGGLGLGVAMRDVAHMQDDVGLDHLLQRRAESRDQHGRQVGDEADRVGQDRPSRRAAASSARSVGSSVANSMSSASTSAAVSRLNSVDLPALV